MNNIFFLEEGILDGLWDGIGLFVEGLLRSIFYPICALVYKMIYYFYNIFEVLCSGQLLERSELNQLFGRISVLLGIIMLFRVAFSFIQALIDPDTGLGDKDKGVPNVIKKVVIVIIMFGISGFVFDLTAEFQALIIKENVVSKFILPQQINHENFGGALSANLFTAFYNVDPNVDPSAFPSDGTIKYTVPRPGVYEMQPVASQNICAHEEYYINGLRKSIKENNDFNFLKNTCLSARGVYAKEDGKTTEEEFIVEFNFLFSLIVGIAVLWFLINYCLSVGIRVVQLTVLQIISPIAFIGYLEPKSDNMFSKWLKVYISTYLDVFIRMGIINLVCYMCALIMEGWNNGAGPFWESVGRPTGKTALIIGIFMILALFQFAKKAPDLLKSIFPTGSSGLSFGTNKEAFKPLDYGARAATGIGLMGAMAAKSAISRRRAALNKMGGKEALGQKPKKPPRSERNNRDVMNSYRDNLEKYKKRRGQLRAATAGGFFSGAIRGGYQGIQKGKVLDKAKKAFSDQVKADDSYDELLAQGGSLKGKIASKISNLVGETLGQKYTRVIKNNETAASHRDSAYDVMSKTGSIAGAENALNGILQGPNESEVHFRERRDRLQKNLDSQKDAGVKAAVDGKSGYYYEEKRVQGLATKEKIKAQIRAEYRQANGQNAIIPEAELDIKVNERINNDKEKFKESLTKQLETFKADLERSDYSPDEINAAVAKFEGPNGFIEKAMASYDNAINNGDNEIFYDFANSVVWESDGDNRRVNQVQAEKAKFDSHCEATGLQYYGYPPKVNEVTGEIEYVDGKAVPDKTKEKVYIKYSDAKEWYGESQVFIDARKYADNTVAHVVSQPDYQGAIAADKANGIDSSSTAK